MVPKWPLEDYFIVVWNLNLRLVVIYFQKLNKIRCTLQYIKITLQETLGSHLNNFGWPPFLNKTRDIYIHQFIFVFICIFLFYVTKVALLRDHMGTDTEKLHYQMGPFRIHYHTKFQNSTNRWGKIWVDSDF